MKGWKTLVFNGAVIIVPVLLQYLASVNWADYVSPTIALYIVTVVNMMLRAITTTPIGRKE